MESPVPFNPRDDERSPGHAPDLSQELRELIAALGNGRATDVALTPFDLERFR